MGEWVCPRCGSTDPSTHTKGCPTAWDAYTQAIRDLWLEGGALSSRKIQANVVGPPISHTTINDIIAGRRLPKWSLFSRVVAALDGDTEKFKTLWTEARGELLHPQPPAPPTLSGTANRTDLEFDPTQPITVRVLDSDGEEKIILPNVLRFVHWGLVMEYEVSPGQRVRAGVPWSFVASITQVLDD